MADVNINKFRASVVRDGSKPASPGFIVSEGQDPVDPAGNGQNHLPVTIATAATGLSITDSQVLGGAGTVGQYIRGDGSLADFPQASGGGSSVNYYLNGSISQGTIGGVAYKELNKVPILGSGTQFSINADGYIASFLTDAGDPNLLEIAGGNWNFETYFSASSSGGTPTFYVELYKYDGTTFTLIASSSTSPELIAFGTNLNPYFSTLAVPTTTLALTDRLAVRFYVTHSGRTITMHTENNTLCQIVTTFTTGLTSLNGLTAQVQNLAVGTSGTDFNIASATATHTFNLPTASATNRGALSSADWTTFNNKQNALGYVPVPETRTITINGTSQDLSANRTYNVGTVTSVGLSSATSGVTIGSSPVTTSGTITLAIATASGSQNGLLSSTDWTTFNNKQNALTNPVTGTGTTNYVPKFTGASTIGNSNIQDSGTLVTVGVAAAFSSTISGSYGATFVIPSESPASGNVALVAKTSNGANDIFRWFDGATTLGVFKNNGNILIGTTTDAGYKLDVNGTGRFTNTLTPIILRGTNASTMWTEYYYNTSTLSGYVGSGSGLLSGANASDFIVRSEADFVIATGGNNRRLTIASTGAATFSSSVTAAGTNYLTNTSTGTATTYQRILNTGGDLILGINNSAGNSLATGGLSYATMMYNNTNTALQFGTNADIKLTITSGGNVLIGTTNDSPSAGIGIKNYADGRIYCVSSSTANTTESYSMYSTGAANYRFYVGWGGTIYATSTSISGISDISLKTNIRDLDKGLQDILQLKPRRFDWKNGDGKDNIGFVAQEIESIFPELISEYKYNQFETKKSLKMGDLIPSLVKAIQEQQEIINDLKQRIK